VRMFQLDEVMSHMSCDQPSNLILTYRMGEKEGDLLLGCFRGGRVCFIVVSGNYMSSRV
jgi:hypothetical protein